jgi:hypothetical protein
MHLSIGYGEVWLKCSLRNILIEYARERDKDIKYTELVYRFVRSLEMSQEKKKENNRETIIEPRIALS